jgi:two-component system, sensor histidine kinase and response regulator
MPCDEVAAVIKILLVDDQVRNLLALEAILSKPNRDLVSVDSGPAAIANLRERDFQLAVLDVMMPGMDGLETAKVLRTILPKLPILFVTALADDATILRDIARLPRSRWLLKPLDTQLLERLVKSVEEGVGWEA